MKMQSLSSAQRNNFSFLFFVAFVMFASILSTGIQFVGHSSSSNKIMHASSETGLPNTDQIHSIPSVDVVAPMVITPVESQPATIQDWMTSTKTWMVEKHESVKSFPSSVIDTSVDEVLELKNWMFGLDTWCKK